MRLLVKNLPLVALFATCFAQTTEDANGQWLKWQMGPCSVTCGEGTVTWTRDCSNAPPKFQGKPCDITKTFPCVKDPCPPVVDGGWSEWREGECNCADGTSVWTRECNNPQPEYGGQPCEGETTKTDSCVRKVRLTAVGDTDGITSGRLEVCYDGIWGTVCDDVTALGGVDWRDYQPNLDVACRELGFSTGFTVPDETIANSIFWLDDVNCTGTETRLFDCPSAPIGDHNCYNYEQVFLGCA